MTAPLGWVEFHGERWPILVPEATVRTVEAERRPLPSPKEQKARASHFVEVRWGTGEASAAGTIGGEIRRLARASGIAVSLGVYLEAQARRHEIIARAIRLAARATTGEDVRKLADEDIDR